MKTNITLVICFILIITFVISFLNKDYQSIESPIEPVQQIAAKIDLTIKTHENIKDKQELNIDKQKTLKTIIQPDIKTFANIDPPNQDDRILFKGIDFTGITNFKIVDVIDDDIYLSTKTFPVFGPSRKLFSVVKIGTSDQGDVYFNGFRKNLEAAINHEELDLNQIIEVIAFTQDEISIELGDFTAPHHPLNIIVDGNILDSANLRVNQVPACAEGDSREITIVNNISNLVATPCITGYKELDINNLIEIKDEEFYKCLSVDRDTTVNIGDPRIKKGWVNKNDIIRISCVTDKIMSVHEIIHFPNLQQLYIASDFPNIELLNNLSNLKYLDITPKWIAINNSTEMEQSRNNRSTTKSKFDSQHIRLLNNLQYLSFYNINLISSNYLTNLNNLETLILSNVVTDNYEFVKFLDNVTFFDITNNQLESFPDIGFAQKIETIRANSNNFNNINGFEDFSNLKELSLRNNNIYSIDNLNLDNSKFTKIDVFSNPISCNQTQMRKYRFLKIKCNN
ncbi:MAG: hypothetical protein HRU38_18860 [Saccharospirillaceae bacterium]|nr:hypothetical protein [Pseudomonadales bacterium]NRB80696.1 hypothetical protein [Saccharospirillaceae bacterium]